MHLGSLRISRFRSCDKVTVSLRSDLTVLVGVAVRARTAWQDHCVGRTLRHQRTRGRLHRLDWAETPRVL